jgi:hypothetical protein
MRLILSYHFIINFLQDEVLKISFQQFKYNK